jgi:LacI family transcriptional regulator
MPTIREVAKRAGVSPATVSRVINRSGPVSERTRERVEAVIRKLGYVPNRLATSLRSSKTQLIAVILSDWTNSFWVEVVRGIQGVAWEHGFHMILSDPEENAGKERGLLTSMLERQVDGLLIRPVGSRGQPVELIQNQGVPVVVLDYHMPDVPVDIVRGDSEGGAYQLAKLLLNLGHRRIALLAGPSHLSSIAMRISGYRRALADAGLEPGSALIVEDASSFEGGYRCARRALAQSPRPTALFATNNRVSFAALRAVRDVGLRVPQDISIAGFDELPAEAAEHPFLTVVEQAPYEIGSQAAKLLLTRIAGNGPQGFQEIVLPTRVVFRESCQPHSRD